MFGNLWCNHQGEVKTGAQKGMQVLNGSGLPDWVMVGLCGQIIGSTSSEMESLGLMIQVKGRMLA